MSAPPEPVVAVCTPVYRDPTYQFYRCRNLLHKYGTRSGCPRPGKTHLLDIVGFPIEIARQNLTADALAWKDITHVLWIDDDMTFPADALYRLMDHDLPIVGGLCHNRRPPYQPILMRKHDPVWGYDEGSYGFMYDYPKGQLVEVDATGGAFLLVKREVFEAVTAKFGLGKWWVPFGGQSEDISFCNRARQCGFKVFVDTGLDIGHVGAIVINEESAKQLRPFELFRWAPAELHHERWEGKPRATVVIPTYNQHPKYLKAAVYSALAQTVPVEVVVVDDGTTDYLLVAADVDLAAPALAGGPPVVQLPPGVRLIHHESNRGISVALNTGIEAMSTDWFVWLSSDDLLDPRKVEIQHQTLMSIGAKAGCHGYNILYADSAFPRYARLPSWRNLEEQRRHLAEVCAVNGSTAMIHRSVFDEVGRFDTTFKYGQDWEMWCRIGQKHLWHVQSEILGTRREGENLTTEITAEDPTSPRRVRRDEEDRLIRERYAP